MINLHPNQGGIFVQSTAEADLSKPQSMRISLLKTKHEIRHTSMSLLTHAFFHITMICPAHDEIFHNL